MKKNYMKPAGVVVAMNLNENIAASVNYAPYAVAYKVDPATGIKYIANTGLAAFVTGNEAYDRFQDWVLATKENLDPLCGVSINLADL